MPVCSIISRPTTVFGSWNAGRQCMNFTFGLPVFSNSAAFTWYGASSRDPLVPDVLGLAHRHPHVGVHEVDAGDRLAGVLGDRDLRAGARGDVAGRSCTTSSGGASDAGPARRTSAPISAPMTSSDRPMLKRQSPTNAYVRAS